MSIGVWGVRCEAVRWTVRVMSESTLLLQRWCEDSVRMYLLLPTLLGAVQVQAGLLGSGTGEGSCAAAPFRAEWVKWSYGCPQFAPCCSEFGYWFVLSAVAPWINCDIIPTADLWPSGSTDSSETATASAMGHHWPRRLSQLRQLPVTMREFQLGRLVLLLM